MAATRNADQQLEQEKKQNPLALHKSRPSLKIGKVREFIDFPKNYLKFNHHQPSTEHPGGNLKENVQLNLGGLAVVKGTSALILKLFLLLRGK